MQNSVRSLKVIRPPNNKKQGESMVLIKSKTFQDYYGTNPDEYYIKFIHHNIDVSDENKEEYLKISEDFNYLYNLDKDAFLIYFSNVENYIKISSNINIENMYNGKVYLRIRNMDEYKEFLRYSHFTNIKLIVDISDIEQLNIKDFDLTIQMDKVSELKEDRLNKLVKNYKIKEILLGQIPYLSKEDMYLYEIMSKMYGIESSKKLELEKLNKVTNDIYTIDEYIRILHKFDEILNQLSIQDKIDGFYKIFDYISNNVSYDEDGVEHTLIINQNLIGPVFNGKSVCEGYSKFLQQMLSLIDVESIVVQGGGRKEEGGHVWNQVLIDGKWYNADVTAASYSLHHGEQVKTCLVKDSGLLYKTNSSISHICDEDYETNNN